MCLTETGCEGAACIQKARGKADRRLFVSTVVNILVRKTNLALYLFKRRDT